MVEYDNIADMFARLEASAVSYVVMRNFDNLLEDSIYMAGHGDIDMLCADMKQTVDAIGAKPSNPEFGEYGDGTHFYIVYKGKKVSVDVRSVGDGYYCESWEKNILATRVLHKCFYVMNEENHLYSLIYHAIFQKPSLSDEYQQRLSDMIGRDSSESELIDCLEDYMKKNGYNYVYANDFRVPLRQCMHDRTLCCYSFSERWPHFKYDTKLKTIDFLVKLKHKIFGDPR